MSSFMDPAEVVDVSPTWRSPPADDASYGRVTPNDRHFSQTARIRTDIEERILLEQEAIYQRWLLVDPAEAEAFRIAPQVIPFVRQDRKR